MGEQETLPWKAVSSVSRSHQSLGTWLLSQLSFEVATQKVKEKKKKKTTTDPWCHLQPSVSLICSEEL